MTITHIQFIDFEQYPDLVEVPFSLPQGSRLSNGFFVLSNAQFEALNPSKALLIQTIENGADYGATLEKVESLTKNTTGFYLQLYRNIQEGRELNMSAKAILQWVYSDLDPSDMTPDKFDAMWGN